MDFNEEDIPSWRGVPGCIILINIHDPYAHNTAEVAHAATCLLVRQYLRLATSNYLSICLYGTESESVVEVCPLEIPSLEDFKKLRDINIHTLNQSKELNMFDALKHCSNMFAKCKKQLSSQTVLILSRLDIPPVVLDQKPTLKRVRDLVDSNIEVVFVNISEQDYKIDEFYEDFITEVNMGKEFIIPKRVWDSKDIENFMHQQSHRHLAVAKLNFEIGDGLAIGVGIYNLIKSQGTFQKKSDLYCKTHETVTSNTKTMKESYTTDNNEAMDVDDDNTRKMPLLKSELLHYQEYGGERVEFTNNELILLKNPFGPPMMRLLGFKSANMLCKEKWYLKPCHFLFPNESIIEGSTVAFKGLHKACIEMSVVAICVLCTRVNARPKIIALYPCTSPLGLDVDIGFDIIQLPFIENVRDLPVTEENKNVPVSDAHKLVVNDILNTLNFEYHSDMFENPQKQSEIRAVEAIALMMEDVETFVDTTKCESDKYDNLQPDLFEEIFGPFGVTTQKRPLPSGCFTKVGEKKPRGANLDRDSILQNVRDNTVNKYSVSQLKEILKSLQINDLPALTGVRKEKLVDYVCKYYK